MGFGACRQGLGSSFTRKVEAGAAPHRAALRSKDARQRATKGVSTPGLGGCQGKETGDSGTPSQPLLPPECQPSLSLMCAKLQGNRKAAAEWGVASGSRPPRVRSAGGSSPVRSVSLGPFSQLTLRSSFSGSFSWPRNRGSQSGRAQSRPARAGKEVNSGPRSRSSSPLGCALGFLPPRAGRRRCRCSSENKMELLVSFVTSLL